MMIIPPHFHTFLPAPLHFALIIKETFTIWKGWSVCDHDNLISLEAHAPDFALIWIDEKLEIASVLHHLPKQETTFLKESLWHAKARIETVGLNRWLERRSAFNGGPR
jgi:hypothetical protein